MFTSYARHQRNLLCFLALLFLLASLPDCTPLTPPHSEPYNEGRLPQENHQTDETKRVDASSEPQQTLDAHTQTEPPQEPDASTQTDIHPKDDKTTPEPATQPEPITQPEPRPEPRPEPTPEPRPEPKPEPTIPPGCVQRTMAMWLAPSLTYESYPVQSIEDLRTVLLQQHVNTVFMNTGEISSDGSQTVYDTPPRSIRTHNTYARRMLGIFQRKPSPIKVFAWIAGTTETNRRAYINLRSASLRNNLVTLATAIVQLGYDGVHFNIEPIPDRTYCPTTADCLNGINRTHTAFVQLLVQLKQAIGQSRISVTTGTYHSYGGSTLLTQNSYKQIIPHTGQLVVLNYDISILAPNATRNQQAIATAANNIIQAAGTQGTKVIFGLPNHNTRRPHHGPHETLANAYLGLSTVLPAVQQMGGFAMYTEQIWTAPDGNPKRMNNFRNRPDWTTWQKLRTLGCP